MKISKLTYVSSRLCRDIPTRDMPYLYSQKPCSPCEKDELLIGGNLGYLGDVRLVIKMILLIRTASNRNCFSPHYFPMWGYALVSHQWGNHSKAGRSCKNDVRQKMPKVKLDFPFENPGYVLDIKQ